MNKILVLGVLMLVLISLLGVSAAGQTCTDPDEDDYFTKTTAFDSTGGSVVDSCTIFYENPPGSGYYTTEYVSSCDNSDPLVVCNIAEGRCNIVNTVYTEFVSCADGCNDGACISTEPVAHPGADYYYFFPGHDAIEQGLDGSQSYDPQGGDLEFLWTCKDGAVTLGTDEITYPDYDTWKTCCDTVPCVRDDTFEITLEVTDIDGYIDTVIVPAGVKEIPFAFTQTSAVLNEVTSGHYSGTATITAYTSHPELFGEGVFTNVLITPIITSGTCNVPANVDHDTATDTVTVTGTGSGTCTENGFGEDPNGGNIFLWGGMLGCDQDLWEEYMMWYTMGRGGGISYRADNGPGDTDVEYNTNSGTLSIENMEFDCSPDAFIEGEWTQTCTASNFNLVGTALPGHDFASAGPTDVEISWKNKQVEVLSGSFSDVTVGETNEDGITELTLVMNIDDALVNADASTVEFTVQAALGRDLDSTFPEGPIAIAGPDGYGYIGYDLTVGFDGSGSTGDSLVYDWSCNGGTVSFGTDAIVYPAWDVWQTCCVGECDLDETFPVTLTVEDIHGNIASDELILQAKEFPFEIGSASLAVTEGSPGVFSGTGNILDGETFMEDYFVNGAFSKKTFTPVVSTCTLDNADMIVDPSTGDVSITANSGICKWNSLGLNTETIYVDSWIASLIAMAYAAAKDTADERPFTADNFGDMSISYSGNDDTLPVTHLAMSGTLGTINEADILNQQYSVSSFVFTGQKLGTPLASASGISLNIHWKNNEIIIDSGALSSINKELPDPDGIIHINSADVTVDSAIVNSPSGTASITGFLAMGDYAIPVETICGQTLTEDYTMTEDLDCSGHGPIVLGADDITFDGAGFTITTDKTAFEATGRINLNIINLNLVGDGLHGSAVEATGSDITLTDVEINAFLDGVRVEDSDLTLANVDINDARIGVNAIGPGVLDITGSVINNGPENFENGVFAQGLDSVSIDSLTVTGHNSGGIFIWDTPAVTLSNIIGNDLVQGITVTDFTTADLDNVEFNNVFTEAMYFSYGNSVTVNNYECTDVHTCAETNQIADSIMTTGTCTGFDYCHSYDYGTAAINGLTASNGETVVEAIGEGASGTLTSTGVTASNVEMCFDLIGGSSHDISSLTCSASVTGINLENVAGALITGSSISDAQTGAYIDADSDNVRFESNLFSNNVVDINNQDSATGDGNTCDATKLIGFADDGQTEGCDYSTAVDADGDGVDDSIDKCIGTPGGNVWYAEVELKPNHWDSSNWLMVDSFGCSCAQVLYCKPGADQGEFKFGCSKGTKDIWEEQSADSWALDCQIDGKVAMAGIDKPFLEDTDSDWVLDVIDGDSDGDGVLNEEDDMIEDQDPPDDPDYGIPDWHPKSKHKQ